MSLRSPAISTLLTILDGLMWAKGQESSTMNDTNTLGENQRTLKIPSVSSFLALYLQLIALFLQLAARQAPLYSSYSEVSISETIGFQ